MYVNDNKLFDFALQDEVLRLISVRSPMAARYTSRVLCAGSGASRQLTIDFAVPHALTDRAAKWSVEERELLVSAMGTRQPTEDGDGVRTPPVRRTVRGQ